MFLAQQPAWSCKTVCKYASKTMRLKVSWKWFTKRNWDKPHGWGGGTGALAVPVSRAAREAQQVSGGRRRGKRWSLFFWGQGALEPLQQVIWKCSPSGTQNKWWGGEGVFCFDFPPLMGRVFYQMGWETRKNILAWFKEALKQQEKASCRKAAPHSDLAWKLNGVYF